MRAPPLDLRAGPLAALIRPDLGATIVALSHRGRLLTQPLPADWAETTNPSALGFFAMTPWFSRILNGRFSFEEQEIVLPAASLGLAHPSHGFLRVRPQTVTEGDGTRATFVDRYDDAGSPYRYRSRLVYALDGDGLSVSLSVTNTGPQTMPFGIGFHPFFRRDEETRIAFFAQGRSEIDAEAMPVGWRPAEAGEADGRARGWQERIGANHSFTGWTGSATLTWPSLGLSAALSAEASVPLNLHVYVPADRPLISLEPVSHLPDVVNRRDLAAFGDMRRLRPGETLAARMRLTIAETN